MMAAGPAAAGAAEPAAARSLLTGTCAELLDADDRPDHLLEVGRRECLAQEVTAERIADRAHDDSLVERQVRVRDVPAVDVDAVTEAPLPVHVGEIAREPLQVLQRRAV